MNPTEQLSAALASRYVIDREIGAGGMATVYLARDVKHNRKVALKLLKPELGAVLGVERFLAEIEVTANLQHPNLLPLFDSGEVGGLLFYVMPYIEGESLRARLEREKQLPVEEAVRICVAIANALDYAHRHGVIHRDLKPENVLLHEGQPLVTDFGIALAVSNAGGNRITQTGLSLGTPQYMSPEQATGDRALDARTDVYSLGAMLYEMLVGDPPHMASTSQAVIAKVLTERASSVRVARAAVPEHVEYAVSRALEKLPADRWASAAEFADAMQGKAAIVRSMTLMGVAGGQARISRLRQGLGVAAAALIVGAGLGAWAWARLYPPPANGAVRFAVNFPTLNPMAGGAGAEIAITPDGKSLIYRTRGRAGVQLARRAMDQLTPSLIPGTDGVAEEAISPDGKWIAFVTGVGSAQVLRKVAIEGGSPTTLAARSAIGPITWGDGMIVFADSAGLYSVAASGGTPRLLALRDTARGEVRMNWPRFLPDGKTILYTSFLRSTSIANARIGVASASGGRTTTLDLPGMFPLGMLDGNVIYARPDGPLMAAKVDLARGRVLGEPTVLEEGVRFGTAGASKSALSSTGTLVYKPGSGFGGDVALVDIRGAATPLFEPKDGSRPQTPAFSPDGKRIAVTLLASDGRLTLWTYDLAGKSLTRLTGDSAYDDRPSWSADPRRVYFLSNRRLANEQAPARFRLWAQAADGSAPPALVADVAGRGEAEVTRDGRGVVFAKQGIWYKNLAGDTAAKPLLTNPAFTYDEPSLSPDGHWLAYRSNETGIPEVYVRAFPGPPSKTLVSSGGGDEPRWAPNGQTLYYRSLATLMAVTVTTKPTFAVVSRAEVPMGQLGLTLFSVHQNYDVSPDGKQFVVISALASDSTGAMIAVVNWFDEVRARLAKR